MLLLGYTLLGTDQTMRAAGIDFVPEIELARNLGVLIMCSVSYLANLSARVRASVAAACHTANTHQPGLARRSTQTQPRAG